MVIELKDVEHLAGLARIAISDDEKEKLKDDLEGILSFVSQIKEVATEVPIPEAGDIRNVMRADSAPHAAGIFTEDLLRVAPAREGDRVVVKKIL